MVSTLKQDEQVWFSRIAYQGRVQIFVALSFLSHSVNKKFPILSMKSGLSFPVLGILPNNFPVCWHMGYIPWTTWHLWSIIPLKTAIFWPNKDWKYNAMDKKNGSLAISVWRRCLGLLVSISISMATCQGWLNYWLFSMLATLVNYHYETGRWQSCSIKWCISLISPQAWLTSDDGVNLSTKINFKLGKASWQRHLFGHKRLGWTMSANAAQPVPY